MTVLNSNICDFELAQDSFGTDASFTAPEVTLSQPASAGDLIFDEVDESPSLLLIQPVGKDAADETFAILVHGWRVRDFQINGVSYREWIPETLAEATCTLGSRAGPAGAPGGSPIDDTVLFADTIALASWCEDSSHLQVLSPAQDYFAQLLVDLRGCRGVRVDFATGGSANAMIARL